MKKNIITICNQDGKRRISHKDHDTKNFQDSTEKKRKEQISHIFFMKDVQKMNNNWKTNKDC